MAETPNAPVTETKRERPVSVERFDAPKAPTTPEQQKVAEIREKLREKHGERLQNATSTAQRTTAEYE